MNRATKTRVFYLILLFLCLLFLEIAARIALANPLFFAKISQGGDYNAEVIWRWQWVDRHRGEKLSERTNFIYDAYHPVRGWQLTKNLRDNTEFYNKGVNTNSKGIRGKTEYLYEKPFGKTRILVFGDSFTFGTSVGDNETYAAYLQGLLPRAEVINMGVFGYGHDQMLLYLKEEGAKYRPDIVILGYLSCDDSRNLLSFRDYAKPTFALRKNKLILRHVPVPSPQKIYREEFWRSKFLDLIAILRHDYLRHSGRLLKEEDKVTKAILSEFGKTVKDMGAVPVFVYLDSIRGSPDFAKDKEFIEYWKSKNIAVTYVAPYKAAIDAQIRKSLNVTGIFYFKGGRGHFSPREHQIIAFAIAKNLSGLGLIK